MALKKLVCNIDERLLAKVDEYADHLHINRTSAISVLISTALEQRQAMQTLNSLVQVYNEESQKSDA